MRITHRHRETRKSKVLNIPSYHIVYPPFDPEKFAAAMGRATEVILTGLERWVTKQEAIEFGLNVKPQDFPMKLLPYEPITNITEPK